MLIYDKILNELKENKNPIELINNIKNEPTDLLIENNPDKNDTLAELINKLSCVTTQMWFNQNILYAIRKMTAEEFKSKYDGNMDILHNIIKKCCDLNVQRANLIDAIDQNLIKMKK